MMSSLSSVVSNLVRASMGTSVPAKVPDEDLDKHVAKLILQEAKRKAENYAEVGIKAYLPAGPDLNAPRTNKRFLSSIIRSTDDHNKTILRAQALAAQEIKQVREEEERRERRARAEEAAAAERSRRRGSRRHPDRWDSRTDRDWDGSRARNWSHDWRRQEDRASGDEHEERRRRRRHRSRSRSHERDKARTRERNRRHKRSRRRSPSREGGSGDEDLHPSGRRSGAHGSHDEERERRRKRRRSSCSLSCSPLGNRATLSCVRSRSPPQQDYHVGNTLRVSKQRSTSSPTQSSDALLDCVSAHIKSHCTEGVSQEVESINHTSSSTSSPPILSEPSPPRRKRGHPSSSATCRSPSVSPPPLPPMALPSKMDKYFDESYDPRLDLAPLTVPAVPKTGLIDDMEYAGWDAMLVLLRQRREDKEEKARLEKLGFPSREVNLERLKKSGVASGGDSIMYIEYKKQGSVREWDLGKEGI